MKRSLVVLLTAVSMSAMTVGTVAPVWAETEVTEENTETTEAAEDSKDADSTDSELEDGVYGVEFDTDSGMFHVNEACNGRATLTVKDGKMTVHISLVSKNIVNLFLGTAEDAQKDGAKLIAPTTDTVTYSDGISEEVYGFNIPVEKLDEEFDLAILGTKGKWYDHKVSVTDAKEQTEEEKNAVVIGEEEEGEEASDAKEEAADTADEKAAEDTTEETKD